MKVSAWPLNDTVVPQDNIFNLLDQLYSGEGVLHANDLAVSADTDGIGVKIAPGGAIISYDSAFGGKRSFFNQTEEKSGPNEHVNPSFQVNASLWTAFGGATLTRDTGTFHSTPASGKIATSGASTFTQGIKTANGAMRINPSEAQYVACWFNAPVGTTVKLKITEWSAALAAGVTHETTAVGTGAWTKITLPSFTAAATARYISTEIQISATGSVNVFVDDFEMGRNFYWITSFSPADPTNPRIDRVVAQIRDTGVVGGGDTSTDVKFRVIPGTPTSGATLANLTGAGATPANSILLANVLVPAAATSLTSGNIDTAVRQQVAVRVDPTIPTSISQLQSDVVALDTRIDVLEANAAYPGEMFHTPVAAVSSFTLLANYGTFTRVTVARKISVSGVGIIIVNEANADLDVGIYRFDDPNDEFDRLWSSGAESNLLNGSYIVNISTGSPGTLVLNPGVYWIGLASDSSAFEVAGRSASALVGVARDSVNTAYPLPANIPITGLLHANRNVYGAIIGLGQAY